MKTGVVLKWVGIGIALFLIVGTQVWGDHEKWPAGLKKENVFRSGPLAGTIILVTIYVAQVTMGDLKGKTNRWVAHNRDFLVNRNDGVFTTHDGTYIARTFGGINVPRIGISLRGRDGTVIVPRRAVREFGDNAVLLCDAKKTPYSKLPADVRELVDTELLPAPYYFGVKSAHVETRGKDWTADVRQYLVQNGLEHQRELAWQRTIQTTQGSARIAHRQLQRALQPKGPTGWIQRLIKTDEKEESDRPEREDP